MEARNSGLLLPNLETLVGSCWFFQFQWLLLAKQQPLELGLLSEY